MGWALTSGPFAATTTADHKSTPTGGASSEASAPSTTAVSKAYATSPAPCGSVTVATIKSLVPGAKTAG